MKFTYSREGAQLVAAGRVALINGVAAVEFHNIRRTAPLAAPRADIEIKADVIYKVFTGLKALSPITTLPDVRPVSSVFRDTGAQIVRVDIENDELVVFLLARSPFQLNRSEHLLESFALRDAEIELVSVDASDSVDAPVQQNGLDESKNMAQTEDDSAMSESARIAAFWAAEDPNEAKQTVVHGAPPAAIPPLRSTKDGSIREPSAKPAVDTGRT